MGFVWAACSHPDLPDAYDHTEGTYYHCDCGQWFRLDYERYLMRCQWEKAETPRTRTGFIITPDPGPGTYA